MIQLTPNLTHSLLLIIGCYCFAAGASWAFPLGLGPVGPNRWLTTTKTSTTGLELLPARPTCTKLQAFKSHGMSRHRHRHESVSTTLALASSFSGGDDDGARKSTMMQNLFGRFSRSKVPKEAKNDGGIWRQINSPITYLVLSTYALFQYQKYVVNNPLYWCLVLFCIKWMRARYLFKIPVWDRQPNWNNVITSKEQEKDLKAFTCKKCGSTIFIAKTREFFFEGTTGIGGLGCFSCGAKGKDNFIMDRDRIVEDVADIDDYFEYERPLDFVSAAERRKLLKEAKGDEVLANKILVERQKDDAGISPSSETSSSNQNNAAVESDDVLDNEISAVEAEFNSSSDEFHGTVLSNGDKGKIVNGNDNIENNTEILSAPRKERKNDEEANERMPERKEGTAIGEVVKPKKKKKKQKVELPAEASTTQVPSKAKLAPALSSSASTDDLDILGMDDF